MEDVKKRMYYKKKARGIIYLEENGHIRGTFRTDKAADAHMKKIERAYSGTYAYLKRRKK